MGRGRLTQDAGPWLDGCFDRSKGGAGLHGPAPSLTLDKAPKRVTNIRDDKAQSKFWRTSFEQRRCLVPASSYCEPKGEKPAMWHWFSINGDEARPVFAFPGVWTRYKGPLKKNGDSVEQEVFAFMTTEPNELTASINHERMPVLLTDPADFETNAPVDVSATSGRPHPSP